MSSSSTVKPTGSDAGQLSRGLRRQILFAVAVGTFMGPLDSSVVNIALPSIKAYFHTSFATVEWVIMAYLLIISSLLLTYGRLGDLYGHKRIYITGFALFTAGSLLCGVAPTVMLLILFRAFQAIGAGMMMSMGPAIITDITPPQERGRSMGVIAVAVSVALTTGPILGGFLTTRFGWQSVFLINIPIGIIGSLWAQRVIPKTGGGEAQPFDTKGASLLFLALISILFPLSYAEKVGWHNLFIPGMLGVGIVLMVVFLLLESRTRYPMVDLTLFQNRLFSMGNLSSLLNYMAQFSVILIMPFYLQQIRQLPPEKAGLMLIPMPLMTMLIAPLSGALSDRVDTRYISSLGMAITTLGLGLLSTLNIDSGNLTIIVFLVITGLGVGMFQTPNNSAVMGTVPPNRRGIASGLLATMRNIGMVLGVAISGALFTSRENWLNNVLAARGLSGVELKVQAFTGALHYTYLVGAVFAGIAVFTSLVRGSLTENNATKGGKG